MSLVLGQITMGVFGNDNYRSLPINTEIAIDFSVIVQPNNYCWHFNIYEQDKFEPGLVITLKTCQLLGIRCMFVCFFVPTGILMA